MKPIRFAICALMAAAALAHAQTNCGLYQPIIQFSEMDLDNSLLVQPQSFPNNGPGYAEAITPDIQALANGLQNDPLKIYNYVHDHIRFVLYYGSLKGAELTLQEQSGNDFDQCALLVALLQAAGYSPGYGFGLLEMPYQATDGTANDLQHWLQLEVVNTNWSNTYFYLANLLGNRGYPVRINMQDGNDVAFQRVWVTLASGGTNYVLDPSFKVYQPVSNLVNLASAMGLSSNSLMTVAGGIDTGNYVTNVNEANLRGTLTGYTTNLLNYLQSNCPNASVQDVLGGWQVVPSTNTTLSQSLLFPTTTDDNNYPLQTWTSEPTNFMSAISISFAGTNQAWFFPQLQGQGVSLSFNSSGTATLWLGNSNVLQTANTGSGSSISVTLSITHPYVGWIESNNVPEDTGYYDQSYSTTYQRTSANYALIYGFEASMKRLNALQQQLNEYLAAGYANTSTQVVNATLNVMGMEWLAQTELSRELLCGQTGQLPEAHHRVGRMAQEAGNGYYVDVYEEVFETLPATGWGTADLQTMDQVFDVNAYMDSAFEHGIIEQLQNSNLVAASTVKLLELANTNGEAVYLATNGNWSAIEGHLVNYSSSLLSQFATDTSDGYYLLLPQNGDIPVAGSGSWPGYCYVELEPSPSDRIMATKIGQYNGGFVSSSAAVVNSAYATFCAQTQPTFFQVTPVLTPAPLAGDPVDMADGTFQVEHTDLSLGSAEPRGITLSRYYNGSRRFSTTGGMTGGWLHNYCVTANNVPAPQAGLGQTTPEQMAAMLVTVSAAFNVYNNTQPDPKNWLVTALITKWGLDQLTRNGVSVDMGKDTLQFVRQPNGVFTPPANCTATLAQNNSAYSLSLRHGNTFNFSAAGLLTNIVDPYGQSVNLTYNASNWVSTIKDWQNRSTLTFTYSGTPQRLASVSDGTRTIGYGYSAVYSPQGDLTSYTDPEGKTGTYTYDTNHEVTSTVDALSRLVISNLYDSEGHVSVQYTEGLTNKMWHIFWSGWQTTVEDPADGQQTYFYDDQSRLIGTQDALGNFSQTLYDGQNHIVATVSPLGETSLLFYDGNNNLTNSTDPLGFPTQFIYDNNDNLIETIDPRGSPTTFAYNAEFSPIGQTNGAGDWVNYTYNTSGANTGTLASRTDSGGTVQFGYDGNGLLNSIAYTGLSTNTFVNNSFGDAISHTDGNGNTTTFTYNNRRERTNIVVSASLTNSFVYDAADNVANVTDARGKVTSQTWSATRHLLATTLPAMPQGTPIVTNGYDNREWLVSTADPLQNSTLYANDPDGRLISQTDPLSRTATFGYDADGRRLTTVNAANETNSQTWDAKSELINLIDGAGHTSVRGYDGAGNQVTLTNRNGNVWLFHFDGANRLTNTVSPRGYATTVAFNHQGLPVSIKDPLGNTTSLAYDGKGRLTNRLDGITTNLYLYDASDNLTGVTNVGQASSLSQTFDADNRMTSFKDARGNLIQYRYDASGNLTNLVYPNGRNVFYAYDSNNHMTNVTDWAGRKTAITYDLDGRMTGIVRPNGTSRAIAYDAAGEATNIWEQMANALPIAWFRYNWNDAAEMQWEFAAPLPHTNTPPTRSMTYNADNQLVKVDGNTVTVDSDGNLTSGPLTNDTFATYAYDARNRLLNVGGVTNAYDMMNNRIGQSYGTNLVAYVINPNASLPQVLVRIKNGVTNYYVYGPGLLYQVIETATATNTLTYHYDYRGSTIALTGDNGLVTDRMEYSLYATLTYRAGTNDTPFLFNGRYGVMTDPNGLLYMRARYYDPFICRFLNPDPSGFPGGLNFYAYATGNPVNYLDAGGLGAAAIANAYCSWLSASPATPANLQDPFGVGTSGELPADYYANVPMAGAIEAQEEAEANRSEPSLFTVVLIGLTILQPETAPATLPALERTTALQPMANAALETGTIRTVAGYELGGNAGLVGSTYNVNLWALYETESSQGPFALINALKSEAGAAGANQISITGNAVVNQGLLNISPGVAGRLGLQFQQINPTTILLQGAVH